MYQYRIGHRVVYCKPDGNGDSESQPLWGGKYGHIPGKIYKIDHSNSNSIYVKFLNGKCSHFKPVYLRPCTLKDRWLNWKETHPNFCLPNKVCPDWLAPYKKYIIATVVLVAVDYFVLKGRCAHKVKDLAKSFVDKVFSSVDKTVEKLVDGKEE